MRVLSLFDGISCGRVALERAGIPITQYMASEVDKYAITVAQKNYPDTIQLGDVRFVRQMAEAGLIGHVDLLIGGSPCTDLSFAGKQEGIGAPTLEEYKRLVNKGFEFKGQSYLFWEYVWIREILKPRWFLLENVRMKKEWLTIFDEVMGVKGYFINSALVSAQNRQRYYWFNWSIGQPEDKGILLRDIVEDGEVDRDKSRAVISSIGRTTTREYFKKNQGQMVANKIINVNPSGRGMNGWVYDTNAKSPTLTTNKGEGVKIKMKQLPRGNNKGFEKEVIKSPSITSNSWEQNNTVSTDNITYRKLTPLECERLQTLPDGYTEGISNSQRYKALGNAWTVDVVAHILRGMSR